MSKPLVSAYLDIKERLKHQREIMAELRKEEARILTEITDYLNQTDETGIRIDESTVITLKSVDKKINRSGKEYRAYLAELCENKGMDDESFVDAILKGKVESTVQQQKIKILKTK